MYVIPRFLYDDMTFSIYSGIKQTLVDTEVIDLRLNAPYTRWQLNLNYASIELKNHIEQALLTHGDELYLKSAIGPSYKIYKLDTISGISYYLTYDFEYKYYNKPMNRPLSYVEEAGYHIIEGAIRIPVDQSVGDPVILISAYPELPRKVVYTDTTFRITHKANNNYSLKFDVLDIAKPLGLPGAFVVGESNADYITNC